MRQAEQRESGSSLLEVTISTALLLATGAIALSFFQSTFHVAQSIKQLLAPQCREPQCVSSDRQSTCACGDERSLVIR